MRARWRPSFRTWHFKSSTTQSSCPPYTSSKNPIRKPCQWGGGGGVQFSGKIWIDIWEVEVDIYIVERLCRPLLGQHAIECRKLLASIGEIKQESGMPEEPRAKSPRIATLVSDESNSSYCVSRKFFARLHPFKSTVLDILVLLHF